MGRIEFLVEAGPHARRNCPLFVSVPAAESAPPPGVRICQEDGQELPAQVLDTCPGWATGARHGTAQVAFLLPALAAGATARLTAEFGDPGQRDTPDAVQMQPADPGAVEARVGGDLLTIFRGEGNPARPCFFPLLGPGGVRVTRSWPLDDSIPGETRDHPHHRSLWVAHGDVNGADNWSEERGHGYQENTRAAAWGGPVVGRLVAASDWTDAAHGKMLEEVRALTVYAAGPEERLFDLDVTFTATECDVRFGDTKEGGILALRVAPAMDGDHGGRIENSYGALGEAECWGRQAHWCDYSGEVDGSRVGIAIFDHPRSFRHPTYWHVRDYGMYTTNPFGWHDFHEDPARDGSHVLARGASLRFHYRVLLHRGTAAEAGVAARYHDYANPPRVRLP